MTIGQNQNKVKKKHFARAIKLAELSPSEDDRPHPKVGVVIVKEGEIIAEAYRGQIGEGDHAEFIALERISRGNSDIENSDLITTLEPCTERSHDKRPCVSWIGTRRIRKVWIGTLDYNPVITGKGETVLRNKGILIGRFPDEYQTRIFEQNREFFEYISSLQPSLSAQQLTERVEILRNIITTELLEMNKSEYVSKATIANRKLVIGAYNRVLILEPDDQNRWNEIGWYLLNAGLYGPAGFAFQTCTKIDDTNFPGWVGRGAVEIAVYKDAPTVFKQLLNPLILARQYLDKAYNLSSKPDKFHRDAWASLGLAYKNLGYKKLTQKCAERAIQLDPDRAKKKKSKPKKAN
jgi:pyrimidine deaminase RibD-like protein